LRPDQEDGEGKPAGDARPNGTIQWTSRCDNLEFFGDDFRARQWISRAHRNPWVMARMRTLLRQEYLTFVTDHDDEQVLVEIARLLSVGRLHLHRERFQKIESEVGTAVEAEPEEQVVAPRQAEPAPVEKAAPPPEEPMFSEGVDPHALAEAQRQAAAAGLPFCEECMKARLARAVPEAPEFSADIDALAMAQAQREAAETGVPFCEECFKAAQKARAPVETPPEEPHFPANVDAAAMAAAQQAAAEQGTAFCEECYKAAMQK
jgi:hypothetical protein